MKIFICSHGKDFILSHVQCLLHAAELSPDEGYMKFLYLGQLHSGQEAAQYFTTAIDIMRRGMEVSGKEWEGVEW